jgi:serine/threonine protein kinase
VPGFELIREVSRGGQAIVYLATQISTGRKVAIKVMREGPFASDREKARFDREAQILIALDHPNIVTVVDRGVTANGSYFLAMPYIAGHPLDQWLADLRAANRGQLPDSADVLKLFMRICDAVNAAHLRGIVHRDLKPSNIRVDPAGEPHILDFGLARAGFGTGHEMGDDESGHPMPVTITGQFMGSLPWASPEQAEGLSSKIDVRSDVYSLGVILYQMLTGLFPYEVAGTMRDVLNNILTARPKPPSQALADRAATERAKAYEKGKRPRRRRADEINSQVEAIVLKALAKRREERYHSAGEFSRDVSLYLSGKPTVAAGLSRQAVRRQRLRLAGAAAAVALVIAGAAWGVSRWIGREHAPSVAASATSANGAAPAIPVPPGGNATAVINPPVPDAPGPLHGYLPLTQQLRYAQRQVGQTFLIEVVGSVRGTVWGTDVYSDDSAVDAAAVHAGLLKDGERGLLAMTVLPGRDQYAGSTRNGVTSLAFGPWERSFALAAGPTSGPGAYTALTEYRDRVGQTITLDVTAATGGIVYGTDVYSDDSAVETAAVHAGILKPGQRGKLRIAILGGQESFSGTPRNGVSSYTWGAWPGSFRFIAPGLGPTSP